MNVIHIATTLAGGAGAGLGRYHQALKHCGVNSRILLLQPPATPDPDVDTITWRKRSLPRRVLMNLDWDTRVEARTLRQLARLDRAASRPPDYELFTLPYSDYCAEDHPWIAEADVVNLHWTSGALDWPRFFQRVRKPIAITLHDQQPYLGGFHYAQDAVNHPHLAKLEARLKSIKQNALAPRRVAVIGNSRWNTAEARASGFFKPGATFDTVYYPLDTDVYRPRSKPAAQSALGLPPDRWMIGFACENINNRRKGFDLLIEALAGLPPALRAQVTLLSFGRDPSPELKARVSLPWTHLGFLDGDEAKVAAYAAMDVFIVPSRAEAFGLTALEAAAVGMPVIATAVGGLIEAVPWATATTPDVLRAELIALLGDESLRAQRSAAGRHLAVTRHAPPAIGQQLRSIYESLVS